MEVNATVQINVADIRHLDRIHDDTPAHTEALQTQLNAALTEIRELREHQSTLERRQMVAKHQGAESSTQHSARLK